MKAGMKFVVLNRENFHREVLKNPFPVLVEFWGRDCTPCQEMSPVIRDLAADYYGLAKVARVDADRFPELANRYDIDLLPSFLLFRNGEPVEKMVGEAPKEVFVEKLDSLILN